MDARLGRIESDTRTIRGYTAMARAPHDAQGIAADMGLQFVRVLSTTDLSEMAGNTLPRDVGRSFRNADLVTLATDGAGTRYIAMEVSFTGKPAQAAVASVRNDRDAVESGEVYWHPLEDRTPSPE